jgi:hypothetical protein
VTPVADVNGVAHGNGPNWDPEGFGWGKNEGHPRQTGTMPMVIGGHVGNRQRRFRGREAVDENNLSLRGAKGNFFLGFCRGKSLKGQNF